MVCLLSQCVGGRKRDFPPSKLACQTRRKSELWVQLEPLLQHVMVRKTPYVILRLLHAYTHSCTPHPYTFQVLSKYTQQYMVLQQGLKIWMGKGLGGLGIGREKEGLEII